jgi:hypothetical protein
MKRFNIKIIKAFMNVARKQRITGKNIISRKNAPLKIPVRAPISVLKRQFIPNGAADRKSRKRPEKNPDVCPIIVPFT